MLSHFHGSKGKNVHKHVHHTHTHIASQLKKTGGGGGGIDFFDNIHNTDAKSSLNQDMGKQRGDSGT